VEVSVNFAAVSDRGRNHHRNEDRVAIADGERKIIVVCDGVSSSTDGQTAAQTASDAITAALAEGADLAEAMQRASSAVSEITYDTRDTAPSTTVVTAVIEGSEIQIAWAGDSRAYWISGEESLQLTMDHSWVNEVVAAGELSYDEASHSPRAHGITRWLGADAPPDAEPSLTTFAVPGPGILLLCTDGLWNYADKVEDLTALVLTAAEESAVETARRLVAFANDQGGHDNISVALLRFAE
jgi:serine/threonine protein phosphatase PrpC